MISSPVFSTDSPEANCSYLMTSYSCPFVSSLGVHTLVLRIYPGTKFSPLSPVKISGTLPLQSLLLNREAGLFNGMQMRSLKQGSQLSHNAPFWSSQAYFVDKIIIWFWVKYAANSGLHCGIVVLWWSSFTPGNVMAHSFLGITWHCVINEYVYIHVFNLIFYLL